MTKWPPSGYSPSCPALSSSHSPPVCAPQRLNASQLHRDMVIDGCLCVVSAGAMLPISRVAGVLESLFFALPLALSSLKLSPWYRLACKVMVSSLTT